MYVHFQLTISNGLPVYDSGVTEQYYTRRDEGTLLATII